MIRKIKSGKYRLYSRKKEAKTCRRKNLGTFDTRAQAEKHERQFFQTRGVRCSLVFRIFKNPHPTRTA